MITVNGITKQYGKKVVLRDATFSAKQGECVAIAGANGSGKSTLLKIMAGTLKAGGGSFVAFGHDMLRETEERERLIGYVPQENPLIPELTARDNLRLWYCNSRYDIDDHWRVHLEAETKITGMFHLNATFYAANVRMGFSYRF